MTSLTGNNLFESFPTPLLVGVEGCAVSSVVGFFTSSTFRTGITMLVTGPVVEFCVLSETWDLTLNDGLSVDNGLEGVRGEEAPDKEAVPLLPDVVKTCNFFT